MTAGSATQLVVLLIVAAAAIALSLAARRWPGGWVTPASRALALMLVASEAAWWAYAAYHRLPLAIALPLHLCDVAPLVLAVALITRRQAWMEVAYFWGLGGCGVALLTPVLPDPPGSFLFDQYVAEHGLAVIAALFIPAGLGFMPSRAAVPRAALATLGLAVVAGLADFTTGGNYMSLARPPDAPTLISLLSPWPWYIPELAAVVLAVLLLLALPFRLVDPAPARSSFGQEVRP
ncbi:MAG TPA: TIGR02206 family membrane protein [Candidatus Dormibacteraeota bacterium]